MAEPLPKWVMKHYSTLWTKFNDKEFRCEQAAKILPDE